MRKISHHDIILFFRQLATLTSAGIPILQSCHLLSFDQKNVGLSRLIQMIKMDIATGKPLSQCLRRSHKCFDVITCQIIEIGEKSGTLENTLRHVALNQEKQYRLRQKITRALTYPILITLVAIISTLVLLIGIVPTFIGLFADANIALPPFTKWVLQLSHGVKSYCGLCLLLSAFFFVPFTMPFCRRRLEIMLLKLPGSALPIKIVVARVSRLLSVTIASGMPLTDALQSLTSLSSSALYRETMAQLQAGVLRGLPLNRLLQRNRYLPFMIVGLIKIGEESGQLDNMLEKIADMCESDIEEGILQLTALLEPLIIIVLGVLIGGLVIAIYLPIFKLGTAIL